MRRDFVVAGRLWRCLLNGCSRFICVELCIVLVMYLSSTHVLTEAPRQSVILGGLYVGNVVVGVCVSGRTNTELLCLPEYI